MQQLLMSNNYWTKVQRNNKVLFIGLLCFVLGQAFFSYKGVENIPFYNYGMYSQICDTPSTYTTIVLYNANNQERIYLEETPAPFLVHYQLNYYAKLLALDSIDPIQKTIHQRSKLLNIRPEYFIERLSNSPQSIVKAPQWWAKRLGVQKIKIKQENYEWVKSNFKLVNNKTLN